MAIIFKVQIQPYSMDKYKQALNLKHYVLVLILVEIIHPNRRRPYYFLNSINEQFG